MFFSPGRPGGHHHGPTLTSIKVGPGDLWSSYVSSPRSFPLPPETSSPRPCYESRVSFEDLLARRLGPFYSILERRRGKEAPRYDRTKLWYRRAAGVEVRARPDQSWAELALCGAGGRWIDLPIAEARAIAGLTRWRPMNELGLDARVLERAIEHDLVYFAPEDPAVSFSGEPGAIERAGGKPIARRAAMWPVPAVETAIEIAPFPFMPRGLDLAASELAGARLVSRERGFEVFGASITGKAETGSALRRLIPLLDGTRT